MISDVAAFMLATAVYWNSLHGFVIDDGSAVRTNQDLRPETPIESLLWHDFWGRPINSSVSVKSYRPLTVLTYRMNFMWHGLDVEGYHAINVILHAACSALVGPCARQLVVVDEFAAAVASLLLQCIRYTSRLSRASSAVPSYCCWFMLLSALSYDKAAAQWHSLPPPSALYTRSG